MTLPDGFRWVKAHQHEHGEPTALVLGDVQVARMIDRIDGTWFVLLEQQRRPAPGEVYAPMVKRDCSSFEQGKLGTEMWACRHEDRLRHEAALAAAVHRKDKV